MAARIQARHRRIKIILVSIKGDTCQDDIEFDAGHHPGLLRGHSEEWDDSDPIIYTQVFLKGSWICCLAEKGRDKIVDGGPADLQGKINVHDELRLINSTVQVAELSKAELQRSLRERPVTLTFQRSAAERGSALPTELRKQALLLLAQYPAEIMRCGRMENLLTVFKSQMSDPLVEIEALSALEQLLGELEHRNRKISADADMTACIESIANHVSHVLASEGP